MMRTLAFALVLIAMLSGATFAVGTCADGTPYGKCSTKNPGNYCTGNIDTPHLSFYTNLCKCEAVPGWMQSGSGDDATCVQAKCNDGTLNGNCAATKPKVCVGGSIYADNATKCGCPAGMRVAEGGIFCESIPCDYNGVTVKSGECSATRPKMCANGALVDNAGKCGCPEGQNAVGRNCADSIHAGLVGADILNSEAGGDGAQGAAGGPSALSCCLPTALIGIIGGFAVFRKK